MNKIKALILAGSFWGCTDSVDSVRVEELKSIGSGFSQSLLRYKKELGGFPDSLPQLYPRFISESQVAKLSNRVPFESQGLVYNEWGYEKWKDSAEVRYILYFNVLSNKRKVPVLFIFDSKDQFWEKEDL